MNRKIGKTETIGKARVSIITHFVQTSNHLTAVTTFVNTATTPFTSLSFRIRTMVIVNNSSNKKCRYASYLAAINSYKS